jgi:predicted DNA-binding protein (UPF0251 family)
MVRPLRQRTIQGEFNATYFKPAGIPVRELESINLTLDELEAVRLTDLEDLYQADAAEKMNISRQTLGNIIKSAHKKIAEALIQGKTISIEGGAVQIVRERYFCSKCNQTFQKKDDQTNCPDCKSKKIKPIKKR